MEPQGEADRLGWCSTPVTVLFADLKDSTELIRVLDPEAAQHLLDPAIHSRMDAVHRFEGTVNQVLGDGIMALFGAPIAHEDHALRACYVALAMQAAMRAYTEEVRRTHGLGLRMRVGLNAGKVVVRAIGNDLHMDYSAVGETTVLAARMDRLPLEEKRLLQTAAVSSRRCPGTSRHRPRPPGARPLSHAPLPSDNARAPRGSTSWAGTHPVGVGVARSIRSAISPWRRARSLARGPPLIVHPCRCGQSHEPHTLSARRVAGPPVGGDGALHADRRLPLQEGAAP